MLGKEIRRLKRFLKKFGLKLDEYERYKISFVHRSYKNINSSIPQNERLEFLGDAVLELIVTDYLFRNYNISEGKLSQIRAKVVSEEPLFRIAKKAGIGKLLYLGKGEELNGGRTKPSILSDALEALIGSIYLIEGFEKAYNFIIPFLKPHIEEIIEKGDFLNPKTELQEIVQKMYKNLPEYRLIEEKNIKGRKEYIIELVINNKKFGPITSESKRKGELKLAELALKELKNKKN